MTNLTGMHSVHDSRVYKRTCLVVAGGGGGGADVPNERRATDSVSGRGDSDRDSGRSESDGRIDRSRCGNRNII